MSSLRSVAFRNIYMAIPSLGIAVFVILYMYAASLYPGGSQADLHSVGFDWVHNYWCNLLNETGMNGMLNPARPFAIAATITLCLSLAYFFGSFAAVMVQKKLWKLLIAGGGALSMLFACLMFTTFHDEVTLIASFFGLFAVIGIMREMYLSSLTSFKIAGLVCLLLIAGNNYIYYTEHGLAFLPLLQKITFAVVLLWIVALNIVLMRKS